MKKSLPMVPTVYSYISHPDTNVWSSLGVPLKMSAFQHYRIVIVDNSGNEWISISDGKGKQVWTINITAAIAMSINMDACDHDERVHVRSSWIQLPLPPLSKPGFPLRLIPFESTSLLHALILVFR
jgi:hypothetical protein